LKNGRSSLAHLLFLITIAIKGVDGLIETLLGILIAVAGPDRLFFFIAQFTTPELEFNPSNHIARAIQNGAAGLARTAGFAVFYLLMHGIVKLGIAVNLLRDKRWIFAPACVILTGFVFYLGYHAALHRSWWSLSFALFDLFTLALVVNEWIRVRAQAH
jgi:uncharacterized membrane protein